MSIEIRPVREDELDRVHFVLSYSFTGDRSDAGRTAGHHLEEMAPATVLLEDGEIVACLRVYPLTMLVNGAPISMGGVSSVACLPEHRRKGHVGTLLRQAMSDMRDNGQSLSALYTPHPALYRRYGWMVAASNLKFTWHPKHVAAYNPSAIRGRAVRVTEEDRSMVEDIYRRYSDRRTGQLVRSERWWKECFFRRIYGDDRKPSDVAVWYDESGKPSGYVCYQNKRDQQPSGPPTQTLWLREFVALSSDAYQGLLRYLLSHDLADEMFWHGPIEDPFAYALDDSYQVKREYVDDLMLRVVDIEKAVPARPAGPGAPDGAFTVSIVDAAAPWNQGTWRIECSGGKLSATRGNGTGDLTMEASTFAAVYDGFMRASDAVRSGLAEASDRKAALLADRIFAVDYPPNGSDFF
jgi:predicted acetyltransferase